MGDDKRFIAASGDNDNYINKVQMSSPVAAQFAISSEGIRQRSKSFYSRFYETITSAPQSISGCVLQKKQDGGSTFLENEISGAMEKLWNSLFVNVSSLTPMHALAFPNLHMPLALY